MKSDSKLLITEATSGLYTNTVTAKDFAEIPRVVDSSDTCSFRTRNLNSFILIANYYHCVRVCQDPHNIVKIVRIELRNQLMGNRKNVKLS